ncbi:hypothetical protein F4819DRAFT_461359 [Hypoxylon fuscum]|nr:hypothetical protein F4819DRAFT_461359 [Hypoxylon fuscum]
MPARQAIFPLLLGSSILVFFLPRFSNDTTAGLAFFEDVPIRHDPAFDIRLRLPLRDLDHKAYQQANRHTTLFFLAVFDLPTYLQIRTCLHRYTTTCYVVVFLRIVHTSPSSTSTKIVLPAP